MSMWMWSKWPAACQIVRKPSFWTSATIPSMSGLSSRPLSALTSSAAEWRHL